jgi:hypothetical protein
VRNLGVVMLAVGILGFVYAGDQMKNGEPVPEGSTVTESLEYGAGRWEIARWGCACLAGFGLLMAMFPKGR